MGFANSAALRLAGVGAATPDPPGGTILRGADGEPSGLLTDTAMQLVAGGRVWVGKGLGSSSDICSSRSVCTTSLPACLPVTVTVCPPGPACRPHPATVGWGAAAGL